MLIYSETVKQQAATHISYPSRQVHTINKVFEKQEQRESRCLYNKRTTTFKTKPKLHILIAPPNKMDNNNNRIQNDNKKGKEKQKQTKNNNQKHHKKPKTTTPTKTEQKQTIFKIQNKINSYTHYSSNLAPITKNYFKQRITIKKKPKTNPPLKKI